MTEPTDTFDESSEIADEDVLTLVDEEGNELACVVLAIAEFEDKEYALLTPEEQLLDDACEAIELLIFEYDEDEEGNAILTGVEDEERYQQVRDFFSTLMDENASDAPEEG